MSEHDKSMYQRWQDLDLRQEIIPVTISGRIQPHRTPKGETCRGDGLLIPDGESEDPYKIGSCHKCHTPLEKDGYNIWIQVVLA